MNRKVILVTDGDGVAQSAVELATYKIGARCISRSGGNPTALNGYEIAELIRIAEHDPIVVMVDDQGRDGVGDGEEVMQYILDQQDIDVLGIIAVSSNGKDCDGVRIACSITNDAKIIEHGVDKDGRDIGEKKICGDTLSILADRQDLLIVGIGDPGKMEYKDEILKGAPITTMALQEVLKRSGYLH